MSEALILESTNPQYDKRLFIDLPVQYMKTTSSEHVVYINCLFVFVLTCCELLTKIHLYTANVLTIKIMDFDHVPNPGIMSPQFL